MTTSPRDVPKTITITATDLRRHLAEVLDLIAEHDLTAVVIYKGKPTATIALDRERTGDAVSRISTNFLRSLHKRNRRKEERPR